MAVVLDGERKRRRQRSGFRVWKKKKDKLGVEGGRQALVGVGGGQGKRNGGRLTDGGKRWRNGKGNVTVEELVKFSLYFTE